MIARIHNFRVKELIIWLAVQQPPLTYRGWRVHIFQDFPSEVMKHRQLFEELKKKMKATGLRTGFIYPARLRVTHVDEIKTFNTPEEA